MTAARVAIAIRNGSVIRVSPAAFGAVAHLGERLVCNQEVAGSTPVGSINQSITRHVFFDCIA